MVRSPVAWAALIQVDLEGAWHAAYDADVVEVVHADDVQLPSTLAALVVVVAGGLVVDDEDRRQGGQDDGQVVAADRYRQASAWSDADGVARSGEAGDLASSC